MKTFLNKRIVVTGCCGTVGSALVNQLLSDKNSGPREVIGLDNNESELFFCEQRYVDDERVSYYLADLRDLNTINEHLKGVDIVFHAAAFKHVVLCERSPMEAVQTNILGLQNIIEAARNNDVNRVVFTSSDKAVNPTSVMGTSKLMGERLITAANSNGREHRTKFSSTRFGNVLGSNGSVIPIFRNQIAAGGPVTVTDPNMTRFVMTIEDAAKLVIDSARLAKGGEVFITKMPVINIYDLAEVMIEVLAPLFGYEVDEISIKSIGSKPGEKIYEELMSDEEMRRAIELESYFSILPAYKGIYREIQYQYEGKINMTVTNPYNSSNEKIMTKTALKEFLVSQNLVSLDIGNTAKERYWPGDKF